jgi:two-component system CheB/CheR fusion protein
MPTTSRIVLVDDDADNLESLQELLQLEGHEVRTATSGPAGLETIAAFHPHVALVDIGMPDMDGYEFARRARAIELQPRPVLIAVTGYGQPEDAQRAMEAGFDAHLTKPIDSEKLGRLFTDIRHM